MSNLIFQNLPFVKFTSNNNSSTFQSISENFADNHFYLLEDGSICEFYKFDNIHDLLPIINSIPDSSVIQIYKLHYSISDTNLYYLCIQVHLDYSSLKPSWLYTLSHVFNGLHFILNGLSRDTIESVNAIKSIIPELFTTQSIFNNEAVNYIYDNDCNNIKSNLSIVKSGEKLISTVSVINLGTLPIVTNVLSEFDYLQVISLARPSSNRSDLLRHNRSDMAMYISSMGESKNNVVHVHTMTSVDSFIESIVGGLFYCNCKFMFTSDSIDSLNSLITKVKNQLNENEIIEYYHTVSGESEYISAFPGNAVYSDHFTLTTRYVAPILINRLLAL